jgi:hypothetical protein
MDSCCFAARSGGFEFPVPAELATTTVINKMEESELL